MKFYLECYFLNPVPAPNGFISIAGCLEIYLIEFYKKVLAEAMQEFYQTDVVLIDWLKNNITDYSLTAGYPRDNFNFDVVGQPTFTGNVLWQIDIPDEQQALVFKLRWM